MRTLKLSISLICAAIAGMTQAQTIDCDALTKFPPAAIRATYDICRYTHLEPEQQIAIAKFTEAENKRYAKMLVADGGLLTNQSKAKLSKFRSAQLAKIMNKEQLEQYYKGLYDEEAKQEAEQLVTILKKKYNLTDQNCKFIRVAMYEYGIKSRVTKTLMADQPKQANKAIAKMRAHYLQTIEDKGGIRVDPDALTVTEVRPFNPTALRYE